MLWPQALLLLLGAQSLQCSGFLDEGLMAETLDEALKLDKMVHQHHHQVNRKTHHHGQNLKHHEHRKGETTCSCNQNQCVSTNYLCRTRLEGGCYFMRNETATVYGCVDQLTEAERRDCKYHKTLTKVKGIVELSCCKDDMCNYNKNSDHTFLSEPVESRGEHPNYDDFWITVLLIAVPTAGLLILMVLVVLAWRILQRDSKYEAPLRSSGYMQCHTDHNGANRHSKARLLLLEDGSPPSDKVTKNVIYKGPQDNVTNWVLASQHGDKPSAV